MGKLNQGDDFAQCPPGMHHAVCVDVEDLGAQNRAAVGQPEVLKPTIRLVFQVAQCDEEGRQIAVWGGYLTNTLHKQSSLRPLLQGWIGNEFEHPDFDTDWLIGRNAFINVILDEKQRSRISSVSPYGGQMGNPLVPRDFTRRHLREGYTPPVPSAYDDSATFSRLLREQGRMQANVQAPAQVNGQANPMAPGAYVPTQGQAPQGYAPQGYPPNQPLPATSHQAAAVMAGQVPASPPPAVSAPPPYVAPPAPQAAPQPAPQAYPAPAAPVAAPQTFDPMTMPQWQELQRLAALLYGPNTSAELDNLSNSIFRHGVLQCNTDEAARLDYELRQRKPAFVAPAPVSGAPIPGASVTPSSYTAPDGNEPDPFADPGEAGYIGDQPPEEIGRLLNGPPLAQPSSYGRI